MTCSASCLCVFDCGLVLAIRWYARFTSSGTLAKYLALEVADEKIVVVMPAFGSSYYLPTAGRDEKWKDWGFEATISGECYGPYEATYGGSVSDATHVCGEMTYQEIVAAISAESAPQLANDAETETDIVFLPTRNRFVTFTGNTAAGTATSTSVWDRFSTHFPALWYPRALRGMLYFVPMIWQLIGC